MNESEQECGESGVRLAQERKQPGLTDLCRPTQVLWSLSFLKDFKLGQSKEKGMSCIMFIFECNRSEES